jgi:hypothetical protein
VRDFSFLLFAANMQSKHLASREKKFSTKSPIRRQLVVNSANVKRLQHFETIFTIRLSCLTSTIESKVLIVNVTPTNYVCNATAVELQAFTSRLMPLHLKRSDVFFTILFMILPTMEKHSLLLCV